MTRAAPIFALLLACLAGLGWASAQSSLLDDAEFIDGLVELGLDEALAHFERTEPGLAPEARAWAESARLRLDAERLLREAADAWSNGDAAEARRLKQASRARFEEALDRLDALGRSEALASHPRRAVWLLELARLTLAEALPRYYEDAESFMAFGVPSAAQRRAVSHHAPRALWAAQEAREAIDQLFARLDRDPAMRDALDAAGRLRKLEAYRDRVLPYVLCEAALLTALLPDDDPYFQRDGLGRPEDVRQQLRRLALARASQLAASEPTLQAEAATLAARAALRLGRPLDALELHLPKARQPESTGGVALHAGLVRALALDLTGQRLPAEDALVDLRLHPAVNADPTWFRLLLVTDAMHRLALRSAQRKPEGEDRRIAMSSAFVEPYEELYADRRVAAAANGLRAYVGSRWDAEVEAGADPAAMPGAVRVSIAERALAAGRTAARRGEPDAAVAAYDRALRASDGLAELLADPALQERARYAQALTLLQQADLAMAGDPASPGAARALFDACEALVALAEDRPSAEQAPQALSTAVGRLARLAAQQPSQAEFAQAYADAGRRLLERYPDTQAANDQRVYFAYAVAQRSGDTAEAVRLYRAQPAGHRDFYEARRLLVSALEQRYTASRRDGAATVDADARELATASRDVRALATAAEGEGLAPAELAKARRARATAELALARLADDRGDLAGLLRLLDGFEDRYAQTPGGGALAESAVRRRILALARAEPIDGEALRAEARNLLDRFRERSAPVVAAVLEQIELEIDALRKQAESNPGQRVALERRAADLGATAVELSRMLVAWAGENDPTRLSRYRLSEAQALLAAGDLDAARAASAALTQGRPSVDALLVRADVLRKISRRDADAQARREALGLYDQVTRFYAPRADAATADAHWAAWAGRCELLLDAGRAAQVARLHRRFVAKYGSNYGAAPYGERIRRAAARAVLDG
ncbi:MAG: hypothetical protein AAGA57_02975 [Planctomycetota bacterium]